MKRLAALVVCMGVGLAATAGAGTEVVTETRKPSGEKSPGHALFDGRRVRIDTASGRQLFSVNVASQAQLTGRATFLPDGRRVLVGLKTFRDKSSQAVLVDTDTGRELRRFE